MTARRPRIPRDFWPFATKPTPEQARFRRSPEHGEPPAAPTLDTYRRPPAPKKDPSR